MLPSAYEFHWDIGHLIFLGVFYTVAAVVLTALAVALYRARRDAKADRSAAIDWEECLHSLPPERLRCRHTMDGSTACRTCQHGFDCAHCTGHREYLAAGEQLPTENDELAGLPPLGLGMNPRRLHHRGHTWVQPQADGTFTVGLDEFARRCFGTPVRVTLPEAGRHLTRGQRCATIERGALNVRLAAPIGGTVLERGRPGDDWLYRVAPSGDEADTTHLLQGEEARLWMLRELEWLQGILAPAGADMSLADGGTPVNDLVRACPEADWDNIWGLVCLES